MDLQKWPVSRVSSYLASRIRTHRKQLGHTQESFSKVCGISLRTYKRIESTGRGSIGNLIIILQATEKVRILEAIFPLQATPRASAVDRIRSLAIRMQDSENV